MSLPSVEPISCAIPWSIVCPIPEHGVGIREPMAFRASPLSNQVAIFLSIAVCPFLILPMRANLNFGVWPIPKPDGLQGCNLIMVVLEIYSWAD